MPVVQTYQASRAWLKFASMPVVSLVGSADPCLAPVAGFKPLAGCSQVTPVNLWPKLLITE
jgi:hypothetical protein